MGVDSFFFNVFLFFFFFFFTALDLPRCLQGFSACSEWGWGCYSLVVVRGLLTAEASLVSKHGL